jgi:hypothetical protein
MLYNSLIPPDLVKLTKTEKLRNDLPVTALCLAKLYV